MNLMQNALGWLTKSRMTVSVTDSRPDGSRRPVSGPRAAMGRLALMALVLAAAAPVSVRDAQAGPAFEIWVTDSGDESTLDDNVLVQTPVRWADYKRPVQMVLFRALNGSVISDTSNGLGEDFITAEDVRRALIRAIDSWNDVSLTNFEFRRNVPYSDYLGGVIEPLALGPYQTMLDTFNLVTFQDPNAGGVAGGVLAATSIYYIQRDYSFTRRTVFPAGTILRELPGGVGEITVGDQPDPSLFLPFREYKAGEIIEADIIMDPDFANWRDFPENPDDLPSSTPRESIRGEVDVQAVFTRELGHVAGLMTTLLQEPVMTGTYRTEPGLNGVDPYDARTLKLDDELGLAQAYPSSDYFAAAGIEGEVRDGRAYDQQNTGDNEADFPLIPDVAVFFGRPTGVPRDQLPVERRLDIVQEYNKGDIHLDVMTLTGRNMRVPGGSGSVDFTGGSSEYIFWLLPDYWAYYGAQMNGRFELHGLPPAPDWYMYANTDDVAFTWTWEFGNRGVIGQIAPVPGEFYGGLNPNRPIPGDGKIADNFNAADGIISNQYLVTVLTETQQYGLGLAGQQVIIDGTPGGYIGIFADDEGYSAITSQRTGKGARYYQNQGRPFGAAPASVDVYDDIQNRAQTTGEITGLDGTAILRVRMRAALTAYNVREGAPPLPKTLVVTATLQNLTGEPQTVAFGHLDRIETGAVGSASRTLFADDTMVRSETGFGGKYGTPLPEVIRFADAPVNPSLQSIFYVQGPGMTPPAEVIVGEWAQMRRTRLLDQKNADGTVSAGFEPRGVPILRSVPGVRPIEEIGLLMRWPETSLPVDNPDTVDVNESEVTYLLAYTYEIDRDFLAAADGPVGTDNVNAVSLDFPQRGSPINVVAGQTVHNIILYSNTGSAGDVLVFEDWDFDGIPNDEDNCPWIANPDQETNENVEPRGVACVGDYDGDGVDDVLDNCFVPDPLSDWPNPSQSDADDDGVGDACDDDIDGDGILNDSDNCPYTPNPGQEPDVCLNDFDSDGVEDAVDNCVTVPNPGQEDTDGDLAGDACDDDIDGDGVLNSQDNCPKFPNPPDDQGVQPDCPESDLTLVHDPSIKDNRLPLDRLFVRAAAFGDLNGDGYLDIVLAVEGISSDPSSLANRIYINQGYKGKPGFFSDETFGIDGTRDSPATDEVGSGNDRLPFLAENTWDVKLADVDLDGDLDIFFSNFLSYTHSRGMTAGAEDRLLINVDVNDPTKNPHVDNDDLGDGFFIDMTDDFLPGMLNTKNMAGPNPLGYQIYGDPSRPVYPPTTRSEFQDIDCDGDPDLILSVFNPQLGTSISGYPDLAGTFLIYDANGAQPTSPELFERPFLNPLGFTTMILINRRDELEMKRPDGAIVTIPRGTPDAFLVFKEQDENLKRRRFNPDPDPEDYFTFNNIIGHGGTVVSQSTLSGSQLFRFRYLGRRLDRYFFRDETLGRDGVFGGSFRLQEVQTPVMDSRFYPLPYIEVEDQRNHDRLPPNYPNLVSTGTPGHPFSSWENDLAYGREIITAQLDHNSGPEIILANQSRPLQGEAIDAILEGYNPVYANLDLFDDTGTILDFDYVDDGYFYLYNFGSDDLINGSTGFNATPPNTYGGIFNLMNVMVSWPFLTIPDGTPGDSGPPESDLIPLRRQHDMGVVVADFNYGGCNELMYYSDARDFVFLDILEVTGEGGGTWRGEEYTRTGLYGTALAYFSDLAGTIIIQSERYKQRSNLPDRTGRTQHATVTDIDRNGTTDILLAQDGPAGVEIYNPNGLGGTQSLLLSNGFNRVAGDWADVSPVALVPNTPISGTFILTGDVDNDSDDDVFVGNYNGLNRLYINNTYTALPRHNNPRQSDYINTVLMQSGEDMPLFYDVNTITLPPYANEAAGIVPIPKNTGNVTMTVETGDLDRDGDPDVVFVNGGEVTETGEQSLVMFNSGLSARPYSTHVFNPGNLAWPAPRLVNNNFPNVFLDQSPRPGYSCATFDYDQDGDLDLFVTYFQDRNRLYENRDSNDPQLFNNYLSLRNAAATPKYFNTFTRYDTDPRDRTSFTKFGELLAGYNRFSQRVFEAVELGDGCLEDVTDDVDMPAGGKIEQAGSFNSSQLNHIPGIADFDNDTFIDIILPAIHERFGEPNTLLLNKQPEGHESNVRTRRFADYSFNLPQRPVLDRFGSPTGVVDGLFDTTHQALASDLDGDGDVDILFVNRQASDPNVEIPGNEHYSPNLVWWSRLLINQGGRQGGQAGKFLDATGFVQGHTPTLTDSFYHRLFGAAKAADVNQDGDYMEDADGNGVVTDEEILAFENLIESLNRTVFSGSPITNSFQDSRIRYQDQDTDYVGVAPGLTIKGPLKPPVDQLIPQSTLSTITRPEAPHDTVTDRTDRAVLWRRKPRWIDSNANGICEPNYDLVLTAEDSKGPMLLLNKGAGEFAVAPAGALPAFSRPTYDVDIRDIDIDGWPDLVFARRVPPVDINDPTLTRERSVVLLWNVTDGANRQEVEFVDVTTNEYPALITTLWRGGQVGEPDGFSHSVKLTDIDGDGDFDLIVGNAGRQLGASWWGAPNHVLFNRVRGASFNARRGLFLSRTVGSGGPIVDPSLKVTGVYPRFAARGASDVRIQVFGTNFVAGAKVVLGDGVNLVEMPKDYWPKKNEPVYIQPKVLTSQVIELRVNIEPDATPSARRVVVINPDGEVASSRDVTFTVMPPEMMPGQTGPTASDATWSLYR